MTLKFPSFLRAWLFLLCLILQNFATPAPAANLVTTATLSITNLNGTTNGQTITFYLGTTNALTYTWTNLPAVVGRYLPATNTAAKATTNFFDKIQRDFTNKLLLNYTAAVGVITLKTYLNDPFSGSISSGWGTLTFATNSPDNNVSMTVSNLNAATINISNQLNMLGNFVKLTGAANGYVWTSDANGIGSWLPVSSSSTNSFNPTNSTFYITTTFRGNVAVATNLTVTNEFRAKGLSVFESSLEIFPATAADSVLLTNNDGNLYITGPVLLEDLGGDKKALSAGLITSTGETVRGNVTVSTNLTVTNQFYAKGLSLFDKSIELFPATAADSVLLTNNDGNLYITGPVLLEDLGGDKKALSAGLITSTGETVRGNVTVSTNLTVTNQFYAKGFSLFDKSIELFPATAADSIVFTNSDGVFSIGNAPFDFLTVNSNATFLALVTVTGTLTASNISSSGTASLNTLTATNVTLQSLTVNNTITLNGAMTAAAAVTLGASSTANTNFTVNGTNIVKDFRMTTGATDGYFLMATNGNGTGVWKPAGGSPGGSDTQVQFNDSGSFGGDAGMVFNKTLNILSVDGGVNASNGYLAGKSGVFVGSSSSWTNTGIIDYTDGIVSGLTFKAGNNMYWMINDNQNGELIPLGANTGIGSLLHPVGSMYVSNVNFLGTVTGLGSFEFPSNSGAVFLANMNITTNATSNSVHSISIGFGTNSNLGVEVSATTLTNNYGYTNNKVIVNGAELLKPFTAYAAGTAYSLTASDALIDFGTTDPTITLTNAGTYLISGQATLKLNGATYASPQTATVHFRRTNNTAADLTSGTVSASIPVVTTYTNTVGIQPVQPVIYTTTNTTDIISLYGSLSATPSAGSVDATSGYIMALRLK